MSDRDWNIEFEHCPRCGCYEAIISEHALFAEDALLVKCMSCGVFGWKNAVFYKVDQDLKLLLDKPLELAR